MVQITSQDHQLGSTDYKLNKKLTTNDKSLQIMIRSSLWFHKNFPFSDIIYLPWCYSTTYKLVYSCKMDQINIPDYSCWAQANTTVSNWLEWLIVLKTGDLNQCLSGWVGVYVVLLWYEDYYIPRWKRSTWNIGSSACLVWHQNI